MIAPGSPLEYLLFEQPWPLAVALVGVAVMLRVLGRRRRVAWFNYVAVVVLAGAVALVLVARHVETVGERIIQRTYDLVAATSPLDFDTLNDILMPDATLTGPDGSIWLMREQIENELSWADGAYGIGEQRIVLVGAETDASDPDHSVSRFELRTVPEEVGTPIRSVWTIYWVRDDGGQWRVEIIRWLEFQGRLPTDSLLR